MVIKPHMREAINNLKGITYAEWKIIKIVVDGCFEQKEREFEKTLELPTEIVSDVIHSRFGEKLSKEEDVFVESAELINEINRQNQNLQEPVTNES